jgi:hypothetical protein
MNLHIFLVILMFILLISMGYVVASQDQSLPVQVTVNSQVAITANWNSTGDNSTINLGSLEADGFQKSWNGGINGEQIFSYSNVKIDVYTRASGDLTSGNSSIPLNKFLFTGGDISTPTPFATNYTQIIDDWSKAQGNPNTAPITLYLTVPYGTEPGKYNTTVYFTAVQI